jgi:hypothetical protein
MLHQEYSVWPIDLAGEKNFLKRLLKPGISDSIAFVNNSRGIVERTSSLSKDNIASHT